MARECRCISLGWSPKLIWVVGIIFAMVLLIQYFELPYGGVLSTLLSAGKARVVNGTAMANETSLFRWPENPIFINGSAPSNQTIVDKSIKNDPVSEKNDGLVDSEADSEDESRSNDTLDLNTTFTPAPAPEPAPATTGNLSSELTPAVPPAKIPSPVISDDLKKSKDGQNVPKDKSVGPIVVKNASVPIKKDRTKPPPPRVVTIAQMNDMFLQSQASYRSMKPRWSSPLDQELLQAKALIENEPSQANEPSLYTPLFRNVSKFKRSYELMEKTLKVYIYTEGERPIFHQPVVKGIYASEGWFMKLLQSNKRYVTRNPKKAHLFYLPFSSRRLEETLYVPDSHSHKNLIQYLSNYLDTIISKYPFWNRTSGADHFLVACHDWAPTETERIMAKCIRALCNSDIVSEGFQFGKDVSLPETFIRNPQNLLRELGGKPPANRNILAFFAGNMHGYLRPILLQHWENKDPDMKIFRRLPKVKGQKNYINFMKSSKYCVCAKGYEVNSPRVVEAIFYECVPVIISDNFVPPFFESLNWESFAVFVLEKDIPNLKNILLSIPKKKYFEMQRRVKHVQKHFLWHPKPVKYDIFHMILHSIWYNRVFQINPR